MVLKSSAVPSLNLPITKRLVFDSEKRQAEEKRRQRIQRILNREARAQQIIENIRAEALVMYFNK